MTIAIPRGESAGHLQAKIPAHVECFNCQISLQATNETSNHILTKGAPGYVQAVTSGIIRG